MRSKKAAAIMLCAVLGTSMITGVSVSAKDKDELVLYTWVLKIFGYRKG